MTLHDGPIRPHDEALMGLALAQAERARGRTSPNPLVGAVVVDESVSPPQVLAVGHHARAGADHAEVAALRALGGSAPGHTIYVTLEPCNHVGRTGKCTDAILAAGLARVVIGQRDPNPRVTGGGIARLRAAGLNVTVGVLEEDCRRQLRGYLRWLATGLPAVTLKAAISLDGKLAPAPEPDGSRPPYWLTDVPARRHAHKLRDQHDAVLIGAGTVLADNPRLDVRLPPEDHPDGHQPLRVVLDGRLRVSPTAAMIGPGALLVASAAAAAARPDLCAAHEAAGANLLIVNSDGPTLDLRAVLTALGQRDLLNVLCEGGSALHGALLRAGLYQRAAIFVSPVLLGEAATPLASGFTVPGFAAAPWLRRVTCTPLGRDVFIDGDIGPEED